MLDSRELLFSFYQYDPLDRLISHSLPDLPGRQRFYCKSRLATEMQGALRFSIIQEGDQLLAQQRSEGNELHSTLLATDQQRSVMQTVKTSLATRSIAYVPYGHRPAECGLLSLLGFHGERPDPVTGHYLLGNGYRSFNPVLMRFNSPDSMSPFGKGGINSYAYCAGDPVNLSDQNGHFPVWPALMKTLGLRRSRRLPTYVLPRAADNTIGTTVAASPAIYKNGPGKIFKYRKTATKTVTVNVEKNGSWEEFSKLQPDPGGNYSVSFRSGSGNPSSGSSTFYAPRSSSFPTVSNRGKGNIPEDDWATMELSYSMEGLLSATGRPRLKADIAPTGHKPLLSYHAGNRTIFIRQT